MKLLDDVLIIAAFAASGAGAATTFPPQAAITGPCLTQYRSLTADYPEVQDLIPWVKSEILTAMMTATNACELQELTATATPPPSLASDWSKQLSMVSTWVSQKSPEVANLVSSSCSEFGFVFEAVTVTNKAGCESLYRKYEGGVPSIPAFGAGKGTGTDGPLLVPATSTPTTSTISMTVGAAASSSKSSNGGAGPRETGAAVGAAAAALMGVVALM
jgi:hypothetical protein